VRRHHQVLGFVSIPLNGHALDAREVEAAVRSQLAVPVARHLEAGGQAWPEGTGDPLTVVVCTRDRPAILEPCLERLQGLCHRNFEVVVVDNAPTDDATRECFARLVGDDARFRYVREPVAGLSRARNRGLREAATRYVAFTDDDVRVDSWWLNGIGAGFARDPRAGCVTGLVPPAELDDPAQQYFDRRYTWSSHMEPRVYDMADGRDRSPLYPYSAGIFGTGANFAVDRDLLLRLGGFDEALGAGSPAGGGEDLDTFVRVLRAGRALVYEPSAVVWHVHRQGADAQRRQLFSYGLGLTAFLSKYLTDPHTLGEILVRLPEGARRMRRMWNPAQIGGRAPAGLIAAEAIGMVAGPAAYLRGRRRLRRAGAPDGAG
jgi:GT2 family glycosyltransferase